MISARCLENQGLKFDVVGLAVQGLFAVAMGNANVMGGIWPRAAGGLIE